MSDERDQADEFAALLQREGYQAPESLGQEAQDISAAQINELSGDHAQYSAELNPSEVTETLESAQALTQGQGYEVQQEAPEAYGQLSPPKQWEIEQQFGQQTAETQTSPEPIAEMENTGPDAQQSEEQQLGPSRFEQQFEQQAADAQTAAEPEQATSEEQTAETEYAEWLDQAEATWSQSEQEFSQFQEPEEIESPQQEDPEQAPEAADDNEYQPTAEDWAEYGEWSAEQDATKDAQMEESPHLAAEEEQQDIDAYFEKYQEQNPSQDASQEQELAQEQEGEDLER